MAENQAPDVDSFCVAIPEVPEGTGVVRIFGGLAIQSTTNPASPSGACSISADLLGNVQAAIAPLQPIFNILDVVATIAQAIMVLSEVITNPFKIGKFISLIPGLTEKVNRLLATIPVFPQGILSMLEMVLDVLSLTLAQLECLLSILNSIQAQLDELTRLSERLNETDDSDVQANLQHLIGCGQRNAQDQADAAVSAFAPLARLLCTIRALLSVVPGGAAIAGQIGVPDFGSIVDISGAIAAVALTRDAVSVARDAVLILGGGFGLQFPSLTFSCAPFDSETAAAEAEPQPTPEIVFLFNPNTVIALPNIPQSSGPDDADFTFDVAGHNFVPTSGLFFGTSQVPQEKIEYIGVVGSSLRLRVHLPADVRTVTGDYYVVVTNEPDGQGSPFSGLSETAGEDVDTGVKTSNLFKIAVV